MKNEKLKFKIIKLDTVDSTNKYAWRLAEKGAPEIVAVSARAQNCGYGRRNRSWQSPKDKGVYLSFLLRPQNSIDQICFLPLILSLGVTRILGETAPQILPPVKIKWPNDVVVAGRKIAGVLVQARGRGGKADFVIAGIGININSRRSEIPEAATSIYMETGIKYSINEVSKKLVKEVISLYKEFKTANINRLLDQVSLYQDSEKFSLDSKDLKETIQLNNFPMSKSE